MSDFSDEMLSAYLDGEVDPQVAAAIDAAVETDLVLAGRLESLSQSDAMLRASAEALLGAVPERLTAIVQDPAPDQGRASADVVTLRPRPRPPVRTTTQWRQLAAASVAALVVGAAIGGAVVRSRDGLVQDRGTGLDAAAPLAAALDHAPSGEETHPAGEVMKVALSFRAADGRLCRQFEVHGRRNATAVACREGRRWTIQGWTAGAARASAGFETAGGPDDPATAAIIDRVGLAEVLDRTAETQAIHDGWAAKPTAATSQRRPG